MCGIAGVLDPAASTAADRLGALASAMASSLVHRGPDASGLWVDADAGVALGHQRLAVIEPGPGGDQPMVSAGGRWVVAYNGEVYNHPELRHRLECAGTRFRSGSDTEVLVAAVEEWGVDSALDACEGMFAAALWDRQDRRLHLLRDRFGEKPLYYGWVGRMFVFGSELKAICTLPGFVAELDRRAVARFLRHNCIPAPDTIYRGVRKLLPGHVVTLTTASTPGVLPDQRCYWSAAEAVARARRHPMKASDSEMTDQLEATLSNAVAARMVADVPVGAFLSGGIDSSAIVALMQQHATGSVRTFTVGFADRSFDESAEATAVAAYLGTDHTAVQVDDAEAVEVIRHLPDIWDEPFADVSQIPTYLVSREARREVTVSLSGDGGDELFAGYNRHAWLDRLWGRAAGVPTGVRRTAGSALSRIPPSVVDRAARATTRVLPVGWQVRNPSNKLTKLARVLSSSDPEDAYQALTTHWADSTSMVLGAGPGDTGEQRGAHLYPALGSPSRCSGSTWSATCPTTSWPNWIERPWRCPSRPEHPSSIDRSSIWLGVCLSMPSSARAEPNGYCARCWNVTYRPAWWTGRKWASACLSEPGCGGSSPPGPSTSSMSAGYVSKGCSTRSRFGGPGISTGRGDGTWATSSGTFWSSSRGSIGGCRL